MLEITQTVCLVVIAVSAWRIGRALAQLAAFLAPKESLQPFDYTEIDRRTMGDSDLAQRNSDYPLGQ